MLNLTSQVLLNAFSSSEKLRIFLDQIVAADAMNVNEGLFSDSIAPSLANETLQAALLESLNTYWFTLPQVFETLPISGRRFFCQMAQPFFFDSISTAFSEAVSDAYFQTILEDVPLSENVYFYDYMAGVLSCLGAERELLAQVLDNLPVGLLTQTLETLPRIDGYYNFLEDFEKTLLQLPSLILQLDELKRAVLIDLFNENIDFVYLWRNNFTHAVSFADYLQLLPANERAVAYQCFELVLPMRIFNPHDFSVIYKVLPRMQQDLFYERFGSYLFDWTRSDSDVRSLLQVLSHNHINHYLKLHGDDLTIYLDSFERYEKIFQVVSPDKRRILFEQFQDAWISEIQTAEDFRKLVKLVPSDKQGEVITSCIDSLLRHQRETTIQLQNLCVRMENATSRWYRWTHNDRQKENVFAEISQAIAGSYLCTDEKIQEVLAALYTNATVVRGCARRETHSLEVLNTLLQRPEFASLVEFVPMNVAATQTPPVSLLRLHS